MYKKILIISLQIVNLQFDYSVKDLSLSINFGSNAFAQQMDIIEGEPNEYWCKEQGLTKDIPYYWIKSPIPCEGVVVWGKTPEDPNDNPQYPDPSIPTSNKDKGQTTQKSNSGLSYSSGTASNTGTSNNFTAPKSAQTDKAPDENILANIKPKNSKDYDETNSIDSELLENISNEEWKSALKYPAGNPRLCNTDPINWYDNAPKAFEGAVMAEYAYFDEETFDKCENKLTSYGWVNADDEAEKMGLILHDPRTGLDCTLLKSTNGKGYALVFAGTALDKFYLDVKIKSPLTAIYDIIKTSLPIDVNFYNPDVKTDIYQFLFGMDSQYEQVMGNALALKQQLGDTQITFVGHSLGGGEAALASIVTGCPALTYNPAALSDATINQIIDLGLWHESRIYRYIMDNDPLNKFSPTESLGTKIGISNLTDGSGHSMKTMIENISCKDQIIWEK